MALGVVKQICTPSSAARPPVNNDSKGSSLSSRFLISPSFIFFLTLFLCVCVCVYAFFHVFITNKRLYMVSSRTQYKILPRSLAFPVKRWNLGQVAVRRRTRAYEIKGGLAFFPRKACQRSPRTRYAAPNEKAARTQETLVITSTRLVRPFDVESFILICCH